jgi:hypothetical protein
MKKIAGKQECAISVSNGCVVVYNRLKNYSFKSAPDWIRHGEPYATAHSRIVAVATHQLTEGARESA